MLSGAYGSVWRGYIQEQAFTGKHWPRLGGGVVGRGNERLWICLFSMTPERSRSLATGREKFRIWKVARPRGEGLYVLPITPYRSCRGVRSPRRCAAGYIVNLVECTCADSHLAFTSSRYIFESLSTGYMLGGS